MLRKKESFGQRARRRYRCDAVLLNRQREIVARASAGGADKVAYDAGFAHAQRRLNISSWNWLPARQAGAAATHFAT